MFDYIETAAEVTAAIKDVGAPITLVVESDGDYDAATSEVVAGKRRYDGFGFKLDYESRHIDGTNVLAGDVRFYLAVDGLPEPKPGNQIEQGGEVWRVVRPKILKPALTAVMYEVQARK
ncbi:MAG TPA: hypothetical protein VGD45_20660 [Steroidobacter sp.]|uniref:hypothetical protein n=1 Tax=Steroidobacter sp. TaxID=1978227 RepID=UPI002EDB71D6